jgi:hypothetical protein
MSQATTSPAEKAQGVRLTPVLPDEKFWVRYSPHHEMPLSSVTSVALHALAIGCGFLLWWWWSTVTEARERPLPSVGTVHIEPGVGGLPGAGGGTGVGDPGSDPVKDERGDQRNQPATNDEIKPTNGRNRPPLTPGHNDPLNSLNLERTIPDWSKLSKPVQEALEDLGSSQGPTLDKDGQVVQPPKKRRGGGNGGGGGGNGGGGDPTTRAARAARWTLIFSTQDGRHYLQQLRYFGAILAVEEPADSGEFLVCYLTKPGKPVWERKDIREIKRIFWTDSDPRSVARLAGALGMQPPKRFHAFFPTDFEVKLLRQERNWAKRREDQIAETRFRIVPTGPGKYKPVVTGQVVRSRP